MPTVPSSAAGTYDLTHDDDGSPASDSVSLLCKRSVTPGALTYVPGGGVSVVPSGLIGILPSSSEDPAHSLNDVATTCYVTVGPGTRTGTFTATVVETSVQV